MAFVKASQFSLSLLVRSFPSFSPFETDLSFFDVFINNHWNLIETIMHFFRIKIQRNRKPRRPSLTHEPEESAILSTAGISQTSSSTNPPRRSRHSLWQIFPFHGQVSVPVNQSMRILWKDWIDKFDWRNCLFFSTRLTIVLTCQSSLNEKK